MATSEEYYWIANDLYHKIKDDFYEIENSDVEDKSDLIEKTIDNAEDALEVIEKIDLKVLKKIYSENIYVITKNINKFKEQADYVVIALKKMRHSMQRHPLPPEMWDEKDRKKWKEQQEERRKNAVKDKRIEFDIMGEGFISLESYKKIIDKNDI